MNDIINLQQQLVSNAIKSLENKIEELYVEGLRLKGYEFFDRYELETFIKTYCRCEDYQDRKEKIYFVKDIPFLLHKYEIDVVLVNVHQSNSVTVNYGKYTYL